MDLHLAVKEFFLGWVAIAFDKKFKKSHQLFTKLSVLLSYGEYTPLFML